MELMEYPGFNRWAKRNSQSWLLLGLESGVRAPKNSETISTLPFNVMAFFVAAAAILAQHSKPTDGSLESGKGVWLGAAVASSEGGMDEAHKSSCAEARELRGAGPIRGRRVEGQRRRERREAELC